MTQNEEEKNELHDFNDIESRDLRDYNRGAVLANIHEKYVGDEGIAASAVKPWLREIDRYLQRIPANEVVSAKEAMKLHLRKRDVIHG